MTTPGRQRKSGIVPYDTRLNPIAPPSAGIFDEPTRPICINVKWIPHLDGVLERLVWEDAWDGDEATVQNAIAQVRKLMVALALGNSCGTMNQLEVRQNPSSSCILESSVDGGETWVQFADLSTCVGIQGPQGEPGPQGVQGPQGPAGADGVDGQDGAQGQQGKDGIANEYPPAPTLSETDALCDASYYITDQIINFIDQTLTDASTITLQEFLEGLLVLGGFDTSLLKQFWDLIVANSYPDLLTDVQASRAEVAEYIYCNEIDKTALIADIDASTTIGEEAQAALIGALNAITDDKLALWTAIGAITDSGEDCSGFNCGDGPQTLTVTFDGTGYADYTLESGVINASVGNPSPSLESVRPASTSTATVIITLPENATVTQVTYQWQGNYNRNTPFVQYLDDNDVVLDTFGQGLASGSGWQTATFTRTVNGVRKLRVRAAVTGFSNEVLHVDNVVVEYQS